MMHHRYWKPLAVFVLLVPAATAAGCRANHSADATPHRTTQPIQLAQPIKVLDGVSGSRVADRAHPDLVLGPSAGATRPHRPLKTAQTQLITNQAQWEALGLAATWPTSIDFDTVDLILIALGKQPDTGYRIQVDAVQQIGDELTVQCTIHTPGDSSAARLISYPFHVAVVPKTGATLAVLDSTVVPAGSP